MYTATTGPGRQGLRTPLDCYWGRRMHGQTPHWTVHLLKQGLWGEALPWSRLGNRESQQERKMQPPFSGASQPVVRSSLMIKSLLRSSDVRRRPSKSCRFARLVIVEVQRVFFSQVAPIQVPLKGRGTPAAPPISHSMQAMQSARIRRLAVGSLANV